MDIEKKSYHLTDRVRTILQMAAKEARDLESMVVNSEHLFLGILDEGGSIAAKMLGKLGFHDHIVRSISREISPRSSGSSLGEPALHPQAKEILKKAYEIACMAGMDIIGSEHLLLAILDQKHSITREIIYRLDKKPEKIRDLVKEVVGYSSQSHRHFTSSSAVQEDCRICGRKASHKVGEEVPHDDPLPDRHNLTAYVCCAHFIEIMGPAHTQACQES